MDKLLTMIGLLLAIGEWACAGGLAKAQVPVETHQYESQSSCVQSSQLSSITPCGASAFSEYVFVGSILSVSSSRGEEKQLLLKPTELFRGAPIQSLEVRTNGADCLPDFNAGDVWLFYIFRTSDTKQLYMSFREPNKPIAEATEDLAMLRRVGAMRDAGMISGDVLHQLGSKRSWQTEDRVPGMPITALRQGDEKPLKTVSDSYGHFEFAPVKPGDYFVKAGSVDGWRTETGYAKVMPKSCASLEFDLAPDGRISGHVMTAAGNPAVDTQVVAMWPKDGTTEYWAAFADKSGAFEISGLAPGDYLVGIGIQPEPPNASPKIYFPGVEDRTQASVITLGIGDKRTDIELRLPE